MYAKSGFLLDSRYGETGMMVNRDSTTAEFLVRVAYAYNFLN